MKIIQILFTASLFFLCCTACQESFFYEETIQLSEENWNYQDSLQFTVNIQDTTQRYDLYLDIVHTTDYPFQNLYTKVTTKYPSKKRIGRQVNIDFADPTGKWYGNCSSQSCNLRVVLQQNAFFNELGAHTITFEQFTRTEKLKGISVVSFKLKAVDDAR